ncbi:UNVERIFIED_CONTAM: hypothetical protein Cloal_3215 [Acetivibrio alkalicellulosi]
MKFGSKQNQNHKEARGRFFCFPGCASDMSLATYSQARGDSGGTVVWWSSPYNYLIGSHSCQVQTTNDIYSVFSNIKNIRNE